LWHNPASKEKLDPSRDSHPELGILQNLTMQEFNNLQGIPRPPRHERVTEDLMIYALPNWTTPPDSSSSSVRHQPEETLVSSLVLSTVIVLVGIMAWTLA
jgi:hypothetical protein